MQRYLIPIIADAVPREFMLAICALMDFRYLAQSRQIDDNMCLSIQAALDVFHAHKHAILNAGGRRGKGNKPLENWHIPKLEFLQSVVPSIKANGVAIQWSADITEHAHITEIKNPARASNNQHYESQICRTLDRAEKCRQFDLATSVHGAAVDLWADDEDADTTEIDPELKMLPDSTISTHPTVHQTVDLFQVASRSNVSESSTLHPQRIFAHPNVAFQLSRDPQLRQMKIDDVAEVFQLPDLRPAIADFLHSVSASQQTRPTTVIGGRRLAPEGCELPFTHLEIWTHLRLQNREYYPPHDVLPPVTINARPPSEAWPRGRYDAVLVNEDPNKVWPSSGLEGK